MHVYSFERLDVWKEARQFVVWLYNITPTFPSDEKFGLILQLKRAAISVVSNLAEGSARKSAKDQAHFYQIAYSSLLEVLSQLIIAGDLQFISEKTLQEGRVKLESLALKVAALRKAQLSKVATSNSKP